MLPFAIRLAVQTDLAPNALAAVIGPQHVMLVQSQMAQFGVLVTAGIVLHELSTSSSRAAQAVYRSRRHRR